jgi:hypothetical protein
VTGLSRRLHMYRVIIPQSDLDNKCPKVYNVAVAPRRWFFRATLLRPYDPIAWFCAAPTKER